MTESATNASFETRCYHCKAIVGSDSIRVEIEGVLHDLCCEDCLQAAERIHQLQLADYYDYRERFDRANDNFEVDQGQFNRAAGSTAAGSGKKSEERRFEFSRSISELPDGVRLSVRIPDIRCAACTWLIESSLKKRPDVTRVRTNLADRVVLIDTTGADPIDIVSFIEDLGFTVLPDRASTAKQVLAQERKSMLARLGVAGIGMMQVMMFALTSYVAGDNGIEPAYQALMRWASLVIAIPVVFYSAMPFHRGAFRDLRHGQPGMDVPVSLAIIAAFTLSLYSTLTQGTEVYFDSVAMFTFLLLIGRFVELGSRQKYQQSQLISDSLLPASALLAGAGQRIPIENVVVGDVVVVGPAESIPVDGVIVTGNTSVIEAAFTGESRPLDKSPGARVLAGSDNLEGKVEVRASTTYRHFVITKISDLYRESATYKPRFSILADVVARYFVVVIILIAGASALGWYLAGASNWFSVGLAVLVVSCPCALSLATPVAYTVATSALRNQGVVISNGMLLERLATITRIVFDKTGTLTRGRLTVTAVAPVTDLAPDEILAIAAALESHSRHPIARAFELPTHHVARDVEVVPGEGVRGEIDGIVYRIGKAAFAGESTLSPPSTEGTWILLASCEPLAWVQLSDQVRDESASVVSSLSDNYAISLYTGDTEPAAREIGRACGIDDVLANLSPSGKLEEVRKRQRAGDRILMIGDGINDTVAMAASDAAIAVSPVDLVVQEAADATL
ncbi:MAG: heavy metal translocating P-type ATPase metal-binding domain-containing protein, partial [Pseudomonadales bacterium]